jgi:hypothetical protein
MPTGTVTFSNGATVLGTVPLSGNTASFTTNSLPVGSLAISAVYNGDSNFTPSAPVTLSITIQPPPPPPSYASYSTPVSFGNVLTGSTSTQALLVTNTGSSPFTIVSATISGTSSPFSVLGTLSSCNGTTALPATLAPSQSCDIDLQFAPTATTGVTAGTLLVVDTATSSNLTGTSVSGGSQRSVSLEGVAAAAIGNGQLTIIGGVAVGQEPVTCNGANNVCTGTSTLGYIVVGCRYIPFPLPASPIPICNTGYGGDGGPALIGMLNLPWAVAADGAGNVYVADAGNRVVRKIDTSGNISTYACVNAGTGAVSYSCQLPSPSYYLVPEGYPFAGAYPSSLTVDGQGNLQVGVAFAGTGAGGTTAMTSDPNGNVYALGVVGSGFGFSQVISKNGNVLFSTQAGSLPIDATFAGLAADVAGNVYTVGTSGVYSEELIQIAPTGKISVIANEVGQLLLSNMAPNGLAMDSNGNFYVLVESGYSTSGSPLLEEYNPTTQAWTVLAGTGANGFNDGNANAPAPSLDFTNLANPSASAIDAPMPATSTDLNNATGIAVAPDGTIYIADTGNNVVRKLVNPNTPTGSQVTVTPKDTTTGTSPVTLTFSTVTQAGMTSLTTSSSGPAPPAGFQLGVGGVYYDISTTAIYTSPVTVCISGSFPAAPTNPQLFHYDQTIQQWVNVTSAGYPTSTMVCGNVSSLSPFALFQPASYSSSQISVTTSGLLYSRVSKTFSGTATITNTSGTTLSGPFQLVLSGLPSGVALLNATGTFGGSPFITISSVTSLAAGQSATVTISFSDPSMTKITFTPIVYSGAL